MDFTKGSNRQAIDTESAKTLREAGALIEDARLERPRWFDGRFLAARDLIREQQYFLTREAHLGQAAGSGVATGLQISPGRDAHSLSIAAGHGLTPSGELVMVEQAMTISLVDIPRAEQLSGKFGLGRIPTPPLRSRSGLFVLALRPVEFTANPIGAYPTSITGQRTVEDGDIIEATAIVLVPWTDNSEGTLDQRRGHTARDIFVVGSDRGLSTNVLPLAMVALDNNTLAWIDVPMLRRELGADRADLPGLGLAPRALRFAHLQQHQLHLADVLAENGNRPFPAAAVFPALPPAGPLPPGVIDVSDFTQRYFPPQVDVDFAIIPEDELPALVEEALALPAFDLAADEATLDASAVVILAPVPRNQWRAVSARLDATLVRPLRPASPNRIAARKPMEILQRMRLPINLAQPASPIDNEWQRLARLDTLWFVRRRNLAYREDAVGSAQRLVGREVFNEILNSRVEALGLKPKLDEALARATPAARGEIAHVLSSSRFLESPGMLAASIGELSRKETLDQTSALNVVADLTARDAGAGFARLEAAGLIDSKDSIAAIADNADWSAVDREAKRAPVDALNRIGLDSSEEALRSKSVLSGIAVQPTEKVPVADVTPTRDSEERLQPADRVVKPGKNVSGRFKIEGETDEVATGKATTKKTGLKPRITKPTRPPK
jgi:hypothetical protein